MARFSCTVEIEADSELSVLGTLEAVPGVTRVYGVEPEDDELPDDDDDDE